MPFPSFPLIRAGLWFPPSPIAHTCVRDRGMFPPSLCRESPRDAGRPKAPVQPQRAHGQQREAREWEGGRSTPGEEAFFHFILDEGRVNISSAFYP